MIFKEVIMKADKQEVKQAFIKLYPDYQDNVEAYMDVFDKLKKIEPEIDDDSIGMIIQVDWQSPIIEEDEGFFTVHGYMPGSPHFFSIEFSDWKHWLSWEADQRFIMMNDINKYIAHCLWEMTWAGFTEEEIKIKVDGITESIEQCEKDIKAGKKFKTWDELKHEYELDLDSFD